MKNIFKLSLMTMLILAMAACNFNPTDWGPGGGGDDRGDDKGDGGGRTDVVMVRGMQGDVVATPCDGVFIVESITMDDRGNTVVVVSVKTEDGMKSITLTKENPNFRIGGCVIHLKGVERVVSPRSDVPQLVAHFHIKKVGSDKKNDRGDDRDDDRDDDRGDDSDDDRDDDSDDDDNDEDEDDEDDDEEEDDDEDDRDDRRDSDRD